MTINESQRRTLDLMAESIGWQWHHIETVSEDMFGEPVAGLTQAQARRLLDAIPHSDEDIEEWVDMPESVPMPGDPCPTCGKPMAGCFVDGRDERGRWGGVGGHCFDCTKSWSIEEYRAMKAQEADDALPA